MAEAWQRHLRHARAVAKARVARRAARQEGRISAFQLAAMGFPYDQTWRWAAQGLLIPVLPRVYAVGHLAPGIESDLASALLYAGPGAMLDHLTAAWWIGALRERPERIIVSTPRRCRSLDRSRTEPFRLSAFDAVEVRGRCACARVWLPRDGRVYGAERRTAKRLPIARLPQLMLHLSRTLADRQIRIVLAQIVFRRLIELDGLRAACRPGTPGSAALRTAIDRHQPRLAKTKSPWEDELIFICEDSGLPIPEINDTINGVQVDAVWYAHKLIVEIDGEGNHGKPSQMKLDRDREMILKELGFLVLRYSADQLKYEPERVAADIRRHLSAREALVPVLS